MTINKYLAKYLLFSMILVTFCFLSLCRLVYAEDIDVTNSEMEVIDPDSIVLRYISSTKGMYWEKYDWNILGDINIDGRIDISDVILSLRIALGLDSPLYTWMPNAFGEDFYFVVAHKTITIDGKYDDWDLGDRIYIDEDGPECGNAPGQDIKEVYVAQDDNYIYIRYVINGPLDSTFGYKFGEKLHIYVGEDISNPTGYMFYATPISALHSQRFDPSFVYVYDNQFEGRFYKCDVKGWWDKRNLSAWCDQGSQTVCRDHVSLPKMIFDFSPCK